MIRLLDIETIDASGQPPQLDANGKTVMAPTEWWQVVCIASILINDHANDGPQVGRADVTVGTDERRMLSMFSTAQEAKEPTVITWNGRAFDLPIINMRCGVHSVPFRWYWSARGAQYRYSDADHLDLMDVLSSHGAARSSKLDSVARAWGFAGKSGSGAQVADLWASGDHEAIAKYCFNDVVQLGHVWARWLLTKRAIHANDEKALHKQLDAAEPTITHVNLPVSLEAAS